VLDADSSFLSNKTSNKKRNWIFQASPQYYDLPGALKALKDQTWLTQQAGSRMEFQVHTTTAKRWPVLLTFPSIGLFRFRDAIRTSSRIS
jgi:hypothetical protein